MISTWDGTVSVVRIDRREKRNALTRQMLRSLPGLVAGAVGALYPAVRAANQDAVKAISYD